MPKRMNARSVQPRRRRSTALASFFEEGCRASWTRLRIRAARVAVIACAAVTCATASGADSPPPAPREWVAGQLPELAQFYRELHQAPELSFLEEQTAAQLAAAQPALAPLLPLLPAATDAGLGADHDRLWREVTYPRLLAYLQGTATAEETLAGIDAAAGAPTP